MDPNLVIVHMIEHAGAYLSILIGVGAIYVILFRRAIYSLLDPLVYLLAFSAFGAADVVYLFVYDFIQGRYFWSYLFTQAAFILGLLWFDSVRPETVRAEAPSIPTDQAGENRIRLVVLFLVAACGYVAAQLAAYAILGIPLLMESRLEMFAEGGATGLLKRIIEVFGPAAVFLAVHFAFFDEGRSLRRPAFALLLFAVAAGLLSGSKASFLGVVGLVFFYKHYAMRWGRSEWPPALKRVLWVLLGGALPAAIVVIAVQSVEGGANPIFVFFYRLVMSGDVYMYAYPEGTIELMQDSNPVFAVFRGFFGNTGVVPWERLPPQLGHELFRYTYPTVDALLGPTPRHNVFGLRYFGPWWSPVYSFALGWAVGYVRNRLYHLLPATVMGGAVYTAFLVPMLAAETDVHLAIGPLSNLLVFGPVLLLASGGLYRLLLNPQHAGELA